MDITQNVARFDRGVVTKATITKEGYLKADAIVTRTGVFLYQNPDGSVRKELRHPDDVFNSDSLQSLKMRPITNGHPPQRLVTADNYKELSIGYTGETVKLDGQYIVTPLLITDRNGVEQVQTRKKQELSLGYTVDLIQEVGTFDGEEYTHRQTNIQYNHLAIVDRARAGAAARIHLDRDDAVECEIARNDERFVLDDVSQSQANQNNVNTPNEEIIDMAENQTLITLDGIDYKTPPEVVNAYKKSCQTVCELTQKLDSMAKEFEVIKAEKDAHAEKLDAIANVDHAQTIRDAVKARVALINTVQKVMGEVNEDLKLDDMSDLEIKTYVVKEKCPTANLDGASDVYVAARFDCLLEDSQTKGVSIAKQRETVAPRIDGQKEIDATDAKQRMIDRAANAWKKDMSKKLNK